MTCWTVYGKHRRTGSFGPCVLGEELVGDNACELPFSITVFLLFLQILSVLSWTMWLVVECR